jgi:hypothetical protein
MGEESKTYVIAWVCYSSDADFNCAAAAAANDDVFGLEGSERREMRWTFGRMMAGNGSSRVINATTVRVAVPPAIQDAGRERLLDGDVGVHVTEDWGRMKRGLGL